MWFAKIRAGVYMIGDYKRTGRAGFLGEVERINETLWVATQDGEKEYTGRTRQEAANKLVKALMKEVAE